MTINRLGKDEFEVSCDHCSESELVDGNFYDVLSEIESKGWKKRKVNDEWEHTCPSCIEDTREALCDHNQD